MIICIVSFIAGFLFATWLCYRYDRKPKCPKCGEVTDVKDGKCNSCRALESVSKRGRKKK
ncbi:MAG: hypothetical protein BV457_00270 [Thermoplasmata archaeon M9B1D]|nr:MAG: hypothetical protein BV457_00270 [Thermoplasmata archaeon M9B1D]PNX52200.1 MAG: hypothetical protein BV456_00025 [Thermoplasmata archaeon M8B2D]